MEVTAKELRTRPGKIIEQVLKGIDIVITVRGKRLAKIVPFTSVEQDSDSGTDQLFGIWQDDQEQSVEEYIRSLRKGRQF